MVHDLVADAVRLDLAGETRHRRDTRNAPSQLVFFSLRNGVVPASGHVFWCGPLSVLYSTSVLSAMPSSSSSLRNFPTCMSCSIMPSLYSSRPSLRRSFFDVRAEVHARAVPPAEERLARLVLLPDPRDGGVRRRRRRSCSMRFFVSGPVSSIFWVPSGMAHERITPRGPNFFRNSGFFG